MILQATKQYITYNISTLSHYSPKDEHVPYNHSNSPLMEFDPPLNLHTVYHSPDNMDHHVSSEAVVPLTNSSKPVQPPHPILSQHPSFLIQLMHHNYVHLISNFYIPVGMEHLIHLVQSMYFLLHVLIVMCR